MLEIEGNIWKLGGELAKDVLYSHGEVSKERGLQLQQTC